MHVAGDPRALVSTCVLDRLPGETRPFDRHAHLIGDRRQQIELLSCQPPPAAHREVHHAERPIAGIERHARMAAQAGGRRRLVRRHGGRQPAASDHIDVPRRQLPLPEQLEAPARSARHAHRLLQIRRQTLDRRVVEAARGRIAQPDPPGLDAKEIHHPPQRLSSGLLLRRRPVERFGDLFQHTQGARLGERAAGSSWTNAHNLRF
jgi:hypothetical protein